MMATLSRIVRINYLLIIITGIICITFPTLAQDIHFSQISQSPLTVNPAQAGLFNGDFRAILNYRNQWSGLEGYRTMQATCDGGLLKNRWSRGYVGMGLNVFSDKAGVAGMSTTQINFSIAIARYYSKNSSLCLGMQGGYGQRSIDYGSLTWDNQYDGFHYDSSLPSGESQPVITRSYADVSTGFLWNYGSSETYFTNDNRFGMRLGVALYHVNRPQVSFYKTGDDPLNTRFVIHSSMRFGRQNTNLSFIPEFLYEQQGKTRETEVGLGLNYLLRENSRYTDFLKGTSIMFNSYYRFNDSFVIGGQLKIMNYAFGVTYDINVTQLSKVATGGPEIFIRYLTPNPFHTSSH